MAELDTSGGGKKGKKVRSKKQSTRVDLTAMVDLAFLLITFFMLTTSLNKPQAMDLSMPNKDQPDVQLPVKESKTLTIVLGSDNKIDWYMGTIEKPLDGPTVTDYSKNGLRKVLLEKNKGVLAQGGAKNNGVLVLIKPSDKSTYKNFVDALDEMKIVDIKSYAVVDIFPQEIDLLKRDKIYN